MPLLPPDMTDPVATGGVDDLLLEEDVEDGDPVGMNPAGVSCSAGVSSSEDGEAPRAPPVTAAARFPTGTPSGGLMSVCREATSDSDLSFCEFTFAKVCTAYGEPEGPAYWRVGYLEVVTAGL